MSNEIDFPILVINSAISLNKLGIKELAWKWEDIQHVITFLTDNGYAILGGDVYRIENRQKLITYDSWYIEKENEISWEEFVKKSKETAIKYIENYHIKNGQDYCYSVIYSKE